MVSTGVIAPPYPQELLEDCASALLLFASGFGGANDGRYLREADIAEVTAVDRDPVTLAAMRADYPEHWRFVQADAQAFAFSARRRGESWDLVCADLPTSLPLQMIEWLPDWCSLARRHVVCTVCRHNFPWHVSVDELPAPPAGWRYARLLKRSTYRGGVYWLVLERA